MSGRFYKFYLDFTESTTIQKIFIDFTKSTTVQKIFICVLSPSYNLTLIISVSATFREILFPTKAHSSSGRFGRLSRYLHDGWRVSASAYVITAS
jgi:hypothetical protein